MDHLGRALEARNPRVWSASFTQQCNPKVICEVAWKLGWEGKTLDASSASRFLVVEAERRGRIFRELSEAGADLCGLEDFVCVRELGLSGFYLHCAADFEVVAAIDEPHCLMSVNAVLYRLSLAGVDVRTHFLSSPGLARGGHTMVMVNRGAWRVGDGSDKRKWPVFASRTDWGVTPSKGFARVNVVYERAGFTRDEWEDKYGGGGSARLNCRCFWVKKKRYPTVGHG